MYFLIKRIIALNLTKLLPCTT